MHIHIHTYIYISIYIYIYIKAQAPAQIHCSLRTLRARGLPRARARAPPFLSEATASSSIIPLCSGDIRRKLTEVFYIFIEVVDFTCFDVGLGNPDFLSFVAESGDISFFDCC